MGASDAKQLDDEEFRGIVSAALRDAVMYIDSQIAAERKQALDFYHARPQGDERDGRSQVIATEVRDTIESMMPSLLRIFCSPERTVEFVPQGPEDVALAEQATDYANFVFNRDNPGFSILNTWIKDGLLSKTGIVKFWWDESEKVTTTEYTGLDDQAYMALLAAVDDDEEVTITEHEAYAPDGSVEMEYDPEDDAKDRAEDAAEGERRMPAPMFPAAPGMLHDVTIERRAKHGKVKIVPVPPEEFIIDRTARDEESAVLVAHRREMPVSELVAMGFEWEDLEGLGTGNYYDDLQFNQEVVARRDYTDILRQASLDPAQRKVLVFDTWMRIDRDGDGIAELRHILVAGPGYKVLLDEPTDHVPFACWCPVPVTHTFFGLSIADLTMDLQRIKSVIMRQVLDNLVLSNHPRVAIVEGQVNIDDAMNDELGAIVRMRAPGMYQPMAVPFVASQSFPVLEYLDVVKESRTGLSRASMGLDPDSLQSTTKAAVSATISAAQGKVEMLARLFAEQGLKKLFRGILKLTCQHQDKPRMIRLRNAWIPVDPRAWDAEMDVTVNVGLGNGRDDEKLQALMLVKQTQEQIIAQYGPNNPMVSLPQYRNTLAKLLEMAGLRDTDKFFQNPPDQMPQQPPPPDPKLVEAQQKAQLAQQQAQAQAQLDAQKMQHAQALEQARLQNDIDIQRFRIEQEIALKREQFNAELEMRKAQMIAEMQLAERGQEMDAHMKARASMQPVKMGGDVG